MGTKRAFQACVAALAFGALLFMTGCSGSSGAAPGTGTSLADRMYAAASPKVGETVFTTNVDDPAKFLMDRFVDAASSDAQLAYTYSDTSSGGVQDSLTLTFTDGSALTVKMSEVGGGQGLKVDGAIIIQP